MNQNKIKWGHCKQAQSKSFLFRNSKGFTLVEMMITVAIIGIIMMIAVPSFEGFQARARQKEGFAHLDAFFVAAHTTRAEFGVFPGNLIQTGFQPAGELNYRLRSNDGTNIGLPINDDACFDTAADKICDCGGACPRYKTWEEKFSGGSQIGTSCVGCFPCAVLGTLVTNDSSFVVGVSGVISLRAGVSDVYYMNELKTIENCQDGLR